MTAVHDLLSAVAIDVEAADWREAIHRAGELLVSTGAAGESYIDEMIAVVEQHGPYVVITPGVAFAHARPDASVSRTAMTVVRLQTPVEFGHETNDPVTIVVALAAVDADAHQDALAGLAGVLGDPRRREQLELATTPEELREALTAQAPATPGTGPAPGAATPDYPATDEDQVQSSAAPAEASGHAVSEDVVASRGLILTVCGNGLGTSLFLKNTLEGVLDTWGWGPHLRVEATDTISARGRANECDAMLTSGAIAQTLGEVGVAVEVIDDFTNSALVDAALRRIYAV
ncbi:MAG: PTS sugar transporter subunit IIA [Mobilicoccus sp.]|nr:PTS sugar transporter subunit IIA [Mobilicoccus sp.]